MAPPAAPSPDSRRWQRNFAQGRQCPVPQLVGSALPRHPPPSPSPPPDSVPRGPECAGPVGAASLDSAASAASAALGEPCVELSPPRLRGPGREPSPSELCVILTCAHGLGGGSIKWCLCRVSSPCWSFHGSSCHRAGSTRPSQFPFTSKDDAGSRRWRLPDAP